MTRQEANIKSPHRPGWPLGLGDAESKCSYSTCKSAENSHLNGLCGSAALQVTEQLLLLMSSYSISLQCFFAVLLSFFFHASLLRLCCAATPFSPLPRLCLYFVSP